MSRTEKSFLNFITGTFSTVLIVALSFVTRSVFLRTLGQDYLGIEGLFSNILSLLSLTELGFGTAIVFRLYKPLEQDDRPRMQVLMKLYRQIYTIIGWIIVVLGVCLIPALPWLIKDYDRLGALGLNAVFIFLLYLFNSASSYWFFAYKSAFVNASQNGYLLTVIGYAVTIASHLTKIIVLALTKNFILYLLADFMFTLIRNLVYAKVCDRRFPFLRVRTEDRVSRAELKDFFHDCTALLIYNVNYVVVSASDNLVLSTFLGLRPVALLANYLSLRYNLSALLDNFLSAIHASLGSIYATGKLEWSRLMFRTVVFASFWIYGVGAIGLAVLANDFISMWVGPEFAVTSWTAGNTVFPAPVALLAGLNVFGYGMCNCYSGFRSTMGLFRQLRFRPLFAMVLNLLLDLLLVKYIGIAACFLSSFFGSCMLTILIDPVIICHKGLEQSAKGHTLQLVTYSAVLIASGAACWWLCGLIPLVGVPGFIVRGCLCVGLPSAAFCLLFYRTVEFRFLMRSTRDLLASKAIFHRGKAEKGDGHDA